MDKQETKEVVKYPAPFLVDWATGTIACCENHSGWIVLLGQEDEIVVPISENLDKSLECKICKYDAE